MMKTEEEIKAMSNRIDALIQQIENMFSGGTVLGKATGVVAKLPLMGSREALSWVMEQDKERAKSLEATIKLAEDGLKEFGGAKDKVRASR